MLIQSFIGIHTCTCNLFRNVPYLSHIKYNFCKFSSVLFLLIFTQNKSSDFPLVALQIRHMYTCFRMSPEATVLLGTS